MPGEDKWTVMGGDWDGLSGGDRGRRVSRRRAAVEDPPVVPVHHRGVQGRRPEEASDAGGGHRPRERGTRFRAAALRRGQRATSRAP